MLSLIIGGAASGKSAYAESLTCAYPGPRIYIATMRVDDDESRTRIERHRARRAACGFTTVECAVSLAQLPMLPAGSTVLLDDLGNLVANELFDPDGAVAHGSAMSDIGAGVAADICALADGVASLTVVSNEIFIDGGAYDEDTMEYIKQLAYADRALAAAAACVVEVVCGLPNILKGEPVLQEVHP